MSEAGREGEWCEGHAVLGVLGCYYVFLSYARGMSRDNGELVHNKRTTPCARACTADEKYIGVASSPTY